MLCCGLHRFGSLIKCIAISCLVSTLLVGSAWARPHDDPHHGGGGGGGSSDNVLGSIIGGVVGGVIGSTIGTSSSTTVVAPTPPPPPAYHSGVTVNIPNLNVRSGPGAGYQVIYQVVQGMQFPLVNSVPGWNCIVLPNGQQGWVSAQYTYIYAY